MKYSEAIEYIHSLLRFGSRPELGRITELLRLLGSPEEKLKFIHIAGTNGKGSTCYMCASVLREAGCKTGLYISPYIIDFRERIQINGEYIPKKALARLVERVRAEADKIDEPVTEFEFVTALAFLYYSEEKCDVIVLETGMGGRFDATNAIQTAAVCGITSVSFDHTAYLGDTLSKIAFEKCGIIKNRTPVVSADLQDEEVLSVIFETAAKTGSKVIIPNTKSVEILEESLTYTKIKYKDSVFKIPFSGQHQIINATLAYEILTAFNPRLDNEILEKGIENAYIPARLERLSENPIIFLDAGHNEAGLETVKAFIEKNLSSKKIITLFGAFKDKDLKKMAEITESFSDCIILTRPDSPRAASGNELKAFFSDNESIFIEDNIKKAYLKAEKKLLKNPETSALIICGSLFFAAEIKKIYKK